MRMKIIKEKVLSLRSKLAGGTAFAYTLAVAVVCALLTGCGDANVSLVKKGKFPGRASETIESVLGRNFSDPEWKSIKGNAGVEVKFTGKINAEAHRKGVAVFTKSVSEKNAIRLFGGDKLKERFQSYSAKIDALEKQKKADLRKMKEAFKKNTASKGITWFGDLKFHLNEMKREKGELQTKWDRTVENVKSYRKDLKKERIKKEELTSKLKRINKKLKSKGIGELEYNYDRNKVEEALKALSRDERWSLEKLKESRTKKKDPKLTVLSNRVEMFEKELNKRYEISDSYSRKISVLKEKANNEGDDEIYEEIKKNRIFPVGCQVELTWSVAADKKRFKLSDLTGGRFKGVYSGGDVFSILFAK